MIAGGPAPLIAPALLAAYKSSVPIAIYIVVCALVSLVAVRLLPDRSGADHNVEYEKQGVAARTGAGRRVGSPTAG